MKEILVPTDFSVHSRNALRVVVDFVKDSPNPCRILLLNTFSVPQSNASEIIRLNDLLKEKSLKGLRRERDEALSYASNPHLKIDIASHMGSLNNVVQQLLSTNRIDLVAMGKDGGRHVENLTPVLRRRECPLLVTYLAE